VPTAILQGVKITVLLGLVWGVLTHGQGWGFGVIAVVAAVLATFLFAPPLPTTWKPFGLARFSLYFLFESLRAGVDVALRALHPKLPLNPGWVDYELQLPPGSSRVLFINAVSLLPGTLSADVKGNVVSIHTLLTATDTEPELHSLEAQIADLFGLNPPREKKS
jgi:multicomponent Na+:H+ antiporter subunit E